MLANLWKEFQELAPEAQAVDLDDASGTAALQMRDGMELLAEWDEHCLWLSALLGTPHPHHALEVYETLLAFVANPREKGGLIVAGGGSGKTLALTAPVPGVADAGSPRSGKRRCAVHRNCSEPQALCGGAGRASPRLGV